MGFTGAQGKVGKGRRGMVLVLDAARFSGFSRVKPRKLEYFARQRARGIHVEPSTRKLELYSGSRVINWKVQDITL